MMQSMKSTSAIGDGNWEVFRCERGGPKFQYMVVGEPPLGHQKRSVANPVISMYLSSIFAGHHFYNQW